MGSGMKRDYIRNDLGDPILFGVDREKKKHLVVDPRPKILQTNAPNQLRRLVGRSKRKNGGVPSSGRVWRFSPFDDDEDGKKS